MTMTQKERNIWLFALDPIHVGVGGTRLSHVDMEIVRDPGDNLPKIPASTLSGNIRTGAARYWRNQQEGNPFCAGMGEGREEGEKHCGVCPVCHGFGTSRENRERMGAFSFHDGLLLFFPLYSYTHGPVWITSHARRKGLLNSILTGQETWNEDEIYTSFADTLVALGRRLFSVDGKYANSLTVAGTSPVDRLAAGGGRLAVVPDALFSRLVNENLETRTSVSIDPLTGTAKSGALFTYEALPRTSLLLARVTWDPMRWPEEEPEGWPAPFDLVDKGTKPLRLSGLGGMGSRGFGRVEATVAAIEEEVTA